MTTLWMVGGILQTFLMKALISHFSVNQVSVIARQHGHILEAFQTEAGDKLEILYMGEYTAEVRDPFKLEFCHECGVAPHLF